MERAFSLRDVSTEPTQVESESPAVLELMEERERLQARVQAMEQRLAHIGDAASTMQALLPNGPMVPRECATGMAYFLEGLARMALNRG